MSRLLKRMPLLFPALVLILFFQNCAGGPDLSGGSADLSSVGYLTDQSFGSSGGSNSTNSSYQSMTVENHHISSAVLDCSVLNPDSAKTLNPNLIRLLGTQLSNGLTLHHHYLALIEMGYSGMLGKGEGNAWLNASPSRLQAQQAYIANAIQTVVPIFNETKSMGYQGVFTCGGAACFKEGQCDSLGRRL